MMIGPSVSTVKRLRTSSMNLSLSATVSFFFFQAEDGIRDLTVTGVQTCALPISVAPGRPRVHARPSGRGVRGLPAGGLQLPRVRAGRGGAGEGRGRPRPLRAR